MWLLELQTADWLWVDPGPARITTAATIALLYLAFCLALRYSRRRKHAGAAHLTTFGSSQPPMLVAFASQTGFAEQLT